ncbi:DUF4377 domain-containing protein [Tamlana sp. 2_MG-2023]|uniref:DUF4377 domain-containing protein n=1 Tax=unclassified Tamlana TaxID=2614803 RepID=UPI0026E34A51|nr:MULTISPECIES: DUF4377 domain-containing protein [unclassified Tamlana]MDO6760147.1 DUF4377 domain-containing protein [Tamlana sp. 2_MG-2023]MDO6790155.1 DUF4377 domain-containing protein [Tamlana sp. 1_MG-2023]
MTYIKTISALFLISIMSISCTSNEDETSILWINSMKVECDAGAGKAQCLQAYEGKDIENAEWTNFYNQIEGFTFEPGLLQNIEVSKTHLDAKSVPADASTIQYKLVKVLEKKQDPRMNLHDIWAATHINGNTIDNSQTEVPNLEINITKMMIFGTDGCNSYSGSIKTLTENTIDFGPIIMTRKMCMNMEVPDAYTKAISNAISYKREGLTLYFYDANNNETLRFSKVD